MNARIKELAIESGLIAPYGSDREGLRDFDYRMFAGLIIAECYEWASENGGISGPIEYAALKKHFGVQE